MERHNTLDNILLSAIHTRKRNSREQTLEQALMRCQAVSNVSTLAVAGGSLPGGAVPPVADGSIESARQRAAMTPGSRSVDDCALWRLEEVLHRFPVSRSAWYAGIAEGRYPQPVQLGRRSVAWRPRDIQALIDSLA